jgi:sugar phosphate isomerase/epimerase
VSETHAATAYDVLTMGRVGVDIYPLQVGVGLEDVESFGKFLGGSATNVAVATARYGRRSAVVTRTGTDPFGRFVHRALRELGVDDAHVSPVDGLPTPHLAHETVVTPWEHKGMVMRSLVEMSKDRDIRYALEPHGLFSRTAEGLEKLIAVSDSPYYVVNFEVGNLMPTPEIDTAQLVPRFLDRTEHVHIKDKVFPPDGGRATTAVIGTGAVNVRGCLEALWRGRYRGPVVIEVFPTSTDDPVAESRAGVEFVRDEMKRLMSEDSGTGS